MTLIKAFDGTINKTLISKWKQIIIPGTFDEQTIVTNGVLKTYNSKKATSLNKINNGAIIYVPENTVMFIFNKSGIYDITDEPGGFKLRLDSFPVFDLNNTFGSLFNHILENVKFNEIDNDETKVAYVNLREIRNIKFGTHGPQVYNDIHYETDLEVISHGSFTIKVTDVITLVKNFIPANTSYYSFSDFKSREQIVSEFLQSFTVALNKMSKEYRISELPSQSIELSKIVASDEYNVGTWPKRFGFELIKATIENIEFTEASRELVRQYSANKMNVKAYENISEETSKIAKEQKIADAIKNNGVNTIIVNNDNLDNKEKKLSLDEQFELLKKLKELLDLGILTQEEFDIKKKQILNL